MAKNLDKMEACQNSGSNHPICPTHQRLAKLRVVKDNYGRPFFVCADRDDLCNFWQWEGCIRKPSITLQARNSMHRT
jgi:hypothetical protein